MSGVFYANLIDGPTELVLRGDTWEGDPFFLRELDLGFPAPRDVVADAAGRDGVTDYTSRFGARTVTAHLYVRDGAASINANLDALRAICAPNKRILMQVMREGWDNPRQLRLRASTFSCLITKTSHVYSEAQLSWSAPAGVLEGTVDVTTYISPAFETSGFWFTPGAAGASAFTFTPGAAGSTAFSFLPGTGQNIQTVVNPGSIPASPVFTIQGPCENPQVILRSENVRLRFSGLSVPAGTSVIIDVGARTIMAGSTSVYSRVDWGASRWFDIPEGTSTVEFDTDSSDTGCTLYVSFTPRYL